MPTWQMFSDDGINFRWVQPNSTSDDPNPSNKTTIQPISNRLPSMEDLLRQGSGKLLETKGGENVSISMFRTGSGKSVEVKQGSFAQVRSFFDEDGGGGGSNKGSYNCNEGSSSMFRTGSGKSVPVKQASFAKAVSIFNNGVSNQKTSKFDGINGYKNESSSMFTKASGKLVLVKQSSVGNARTVFHEDRVCNTGSLKLAENNGCSNEISSMFTTGSGKSVLVKQASIVKALLIFNEDGASNGGSSKLAETNESRNPSFSMFKTGSGKSVTLKQSSISKAMSVLGEEGVINGESLKFVHDNGGNTSSQMFQTASGKPVPVEESSVFKALSVLDEVDVTDGGQVSATTTSHNIENSFFQSGSGKMVNLSSAGLIRAKKLLGLEDNSKQFKFLEFDISENSANFEKCGQTDMCTDSEEVLPNIFGAERCKVALKSPPIMFHSAGGRSISVSNDALQRARSLLGDLAVDGSGKEGSKKSTLHSYHKDNISNLASNYKDNDSSVSTSIKYPLKSSITTKSCPLPKEPFFKQKKASTNLQTLNSRCNLLKQFDENGPIASDSKIAPLGRSLGGPLVDISNQIGSADIQHNFTNKKRRLGQKSSFSPFKRPRSSGFSTPMNTTFGFPLHGQSEKVSALLKPEDSGCRKKVFSRYPFQVQKRSPREFFGGPPSLKDIENIPDKVRYMTADSAKTFMFDDVSGLGIIGPESFQMMLVESGAAMQYASIGWVKNHYKWIVWKLACYERGYSAKGTRSYLTVSNVREELKYRYEREVNCGHRSSLRRILEGDASPSSMMVLCVSAIHFTKRNLDAECPQAPHMDSHVLTTNLSENSNFAKIELTDGWYSVDALLDLPLSKQLAVGKLYIGQKIRVWRAALCGWSGPIPPLELSKAVALQLHINGTYRAHWADCLGFCKNHGSPLAFNCIKGGGGVVPKTLVGVVRIYPILYKERLGDGGSVVRSERMENKTLQIYNQRRSTIAEGVVSELNDRTNYCADSENDSEEGHKICKILETSAEPDVVMADMSTEQLNSFATYQARQEACRESDMRKKVEKALEDAGVNKREVTQFIRLRVISLTNKKSQRKKQPKQGLITIWIPTEQQKLELVEGHAYIVSGLLPLSSDLDTIYLQARGSTTTWQPLHPLATASYEPFSSPRESVQLLSLGEVALAREFDIAAVVVYVGKVTGHQNKQWVFVTDSSVSESEVRPEGSLDCLLAISFCSPSLDKESIAPINPSLAGSTVGFSNLIKRAQDQINHIWVAEATDNSTYSFYHELPRFSHLKEPVLSNQKWAKIYSLDIAKLKERVLSIIGDCES